MIAENTKAPDFTLPDSEGNQVSLSDFTGKRVLLVFYPESRIKRTLLGGHSQIFQEQPISGD